MNTSPPSPTRQMISPRRTRVALGAALLTLALPAVAHAQYAYFYLNHSSGGPDLPCFYEAVSPVTLSSTCASQLSGTTHAFFGTSDGRSYTLSTSGSGDGDEYGAGEGFMAYQRVSSFSFTGPATPAQLYFYYTVALSASASGASNQAFAVAEASLVYRNYTLSREEVGVISEVPYSQAFGVTDLGNGVHRGEVSYAGDGMFEISLLASWNWAGPGEALADVEFRYLGMDAVDAEGNSLAGEMGCTDSISGDCRLGQIDSPVPEPATILLLVTGLGVLAPVIRQRKTLASDAR